MDTSAVTTPIASRTNETAAATASTESAISSDFETFLVMLTAQMKNQDPLDPLDSQDFATQLATFSSVEQQVKTNDLIAALSSQFTTSNLGEMAGWVGMEARMAIPAEFSGSPIEVVPNPPTVADRVELVVWNGAGVEQQRISIPKSDTPLQWAGVGDNGQPLPNGEYSFEVVSYSNDEVIDASIPEVFVEIAEVRSVDGEALVALQNGELYPASLVRGLR